MNPMQMIVNAARRLETLFPGYFQQAKHNHYADFGWPVNLTFSQLHAMYHRNGLARAGVDKTILKTWQDNPQLWETEKPSETALEADIRQRFADLRIWQAMAAADRRALVGGYSGLILRFRDSKPFDAPVDRVPGGLEGLAEVIPAWGGIGAQLEVAEWVTDTASADYGKPKLFRFNEAAVGAEQNQVRQFMLHPDRVLIWSEDGTVHARSALEPGYNDLLDAEKVKGAGGEGFWKTARGSLALEADKDLDMNAMARAMGVQPSEIADKMNEQVEDFQKGFDKMIALQGMTAKTLPINLPSPEHFFGIAVQSFAASINIPTKILIGNQTGERASTEDARDWAQANNARRTNEIRPLIGELIQRLERVGILPERDWHLHWSDLTEASQAEKIERAAKMADINQKQRDEPAFLADEIRQVAGFETAAPDGGDE